MSEMLEAGPDEERLSPEVRAALPRTTTNPWQTQSSRVVHETRWMRVWEDAVTRPDGGDGTWGYVELTVPNVVVIAALDDQERVHLVRQWRYAWRRDSWEFPAGRAELGEAPLESAQRELQEETGLRARTWTSLGTFFASALLATQFHLFLAQDLEMGRPHRDGEEQDMIATVVPLALAVQAVMEGAIVHSASAASILKLAHVLDNAR